MLLETSARLASRINSAAKQTSAVYGFSIRAYVSKTMFVASNAAANRAANQDRVI